LSSSSFSDQFIGISATFVVGERMAIAAGHRDPRDMHGDASVLGGSPHDHQV
jgi:hypothetical protein